jgi:hypothetical protein
MIVNIMFYYILIQVEDIVEHDVDNHSKIQVEDIVEHDVDNHSRIQVEDIVEHDTSCSTISSTCI